MEQQIFAAVVGDRVAPRSRMVHLDDDPALPPVHLVYVFWIVLGGPVTLVDTGFPADVAAARSIQNYRDPIDSLRALSIVPGDVERVVATHLHYDHFCAPQRFPNANYYVQGADVDYFSTAGSAHPAAAFADAATMRELGGLRASGRLTELDGDADLGGLRLIRIGGHTPGSQIVVVDGERPIVLAGDSAHLYENLEGRRPTALIHAYDKYIDGFDVIERASLGGTWFPGHDPRMLETMDVVGDGLYRVRTDKQEGTA